MYRQLVAGHVIGGKGDGGVEAGAQDVRRLVGQTKDDVERHRLESARDALAHRLLRTGGVVAAAEKTQLRIVEGLYAEAHRGDAQGTPRRHCRVANVFGVRLEENPGVVAHRQIGAHRIKQATELIGAEERGGAATEVDGVDGGWPVAPPGRLADQVPNEGLALPGRPDAHREVAVRTHRGAEGDMQIEPGPFTRVGWRRSDHGKRARRSTRCRPANTHDRVSGGLSGAIGATSRARLQFPD